LVRGSIREVRRGWYGRKALIFMHFHEVFLGSQHEIWSKQHNGKVSRLLSSTGCLVNSIDMDRGAEIYKAAGWTSHASLGLLHIRRPATPEAEESRSCASAMPAALRPHTSLAPSAPQSPPRRHSLAAAACCPEGRMLPVATDVHTHG
jgi:hypothetical protein